MGRLDRRRHLTLDVRVIGKNRILVTCPRGVPPVLKAEIEGLGLEATREAVLGVETEGTLEDCMRLNLQLRTGHRVLWLIEEFRARDAAEMYARVNAIPWEDILSADEHLSVTSSVENETITDTRFANMKCKDAIVDRLKARTGRRPDSGPERANAVVFLYWKGVRCGLFLDTTGEPLPKRGYRKIPWKAPMQESLAAAVVLSTRWDRKIPFVNPMCGSGTLAIEAALVGLNRAPGLLRDNFGFMHVKEWIITGRGGGRCPESLEEYLPPGRPRNQRTTLEKAWVSIRNEAKKTAMKSLPGKIIATDIDPKAIDAARQNARIAGVEHLIEFKVCDFGDTEIPEDHGVVVLNPEYGERMGDERKLEPLYGRIGDFLKQRCTGYTGYVFTGNLNLAKKVGLHAKRRIPFWNGAIECRLLEYEMY